MEENNFIKKYWGQLLFAGALILSVGKTLNVVTQLEQKVSDLIVVIEHKEKISNEEDQGVFRDMTALAECNKTIAELENEVLYYKIMYEASNNK